MAPASIAVAFEAGAVRFKRYPFRGASVPGLVPATRVQEVYPRWPALFTTEGEFLFVPAADREALAEWAQAHQVPCLDREDPWERLLAPFLDTEYTEAAAASDEAALAAMGLGPETVAAWRSRLEGRMTWSVCFTYEWIALGLLDLLLATHALSLDGWWRPGRFYDAVMAVARHGPTSPLEDME